MKILKISLSLLLCTALCLSMWSAAVAADSSSDIVGVFGTDVISTDAELELWMEAHQSTPGTVRLAASVTLPQQDNGYRYMGTEPLKIETGAHTLTLGESYGELQGTISITGEGVDGPVVTGEKLALRGGVQITSTGRDGQGGMAVSARQAFLTSVDVSAYGTDATGLECAELSASQSTFTVHGGNSAALRLLDDGSEWYVNGELTGCMLTADGEGAVSVDAQGRAKDTRFKMCCLQPQPDFVSVEELTPAPGWNRRISMQEPGGGLSLPKSVVIQAYDAAKQSVNASLTLDWPEELPDVSAPGAYLLEATVLSGELPSLVGEAFGLEVFVGDILPPRMNAPVVCFDTEGAVDLLRFPIPWGVGGKNTQLWYSADDGQTWSIGADSCFIEAKLDAALLEPERAYLLALRADKDSVTDGVSPVWSLTLHGNGSYTFALTDKESPDLSVLNDTLSSWEEILEKINDISRVHNDYKVNRDLTVEAGQYLDLQHEGEIPIFLDFGENGITVEDGGWLILGIDELRGEGVEQPLITVEPGGSLVLSGLNNYVPQTPQGIRATGTEAAGGVAVELRDGGRLYAQKEPRISAEGSGAVAIRSLSTKPFSLPAGMCLSATGTGAAALETYGDADVFYAEVLATGENASAVRAPAGAKVALVSASVSPAPDGAVVRQGVFGGFNKDLSEPYRLWLGKRSGMHLSTVPLYAGITIPTADGGERVEAVLIDCRWEDGNVDYTKAGSYKATARFSSRFGVLEGMPDSQEVEVGILESGKKPDISVIHPLPLIRVGGMPLVYGFTIWCNDRFTADIATLWCSTDNGDTWKKADESLSVWWSYEDMPLACAQITVAGMEPETPYLFRLDSAGSSTSGITVMAGFSEAREVVLRSDGTVINMDWSGDRDGGDVDGAKPGGGEIEQRPPALDGGGDESSRGGTDGDHEDAETTPQQPPAETTPPAENTLPTQTPTPQPEPIPTQKPDQTEAPSIPAMAAPSPQPGDFMEVFGENRDVISGTRLLMMLKDTGQAQFSKQGVTVYFSAEALYAQQIQDSDRIEVTVEKEAEDTVLLTVSVNDAPLSALPDTRLFVPYQPSPEGAALHLVDEQGKTVSEGDYDAALDVASFHVDTLGRFTVSAEAPVSQRAASLTESTEPIEAGKGTALWLLLPAAGVPLALAFWRFWKRRRRT